MNRFIRNSILFLLPFFLGIVILFSLPVNKKFAYNFVKGECNDKSSWIYHRIFENPRSIDIAFSGASQTACAIMDNYIEEQLQAQTNEKVHVANLGYCRRGRDIQYVMLKDLFEHKKPEILVIEVAEDEPQKSHPVFPYLSESGDLFASAIFLNQRYFVSLFKGLVLRFEQIKAKLFSGSSLSQQYSDYAYISGPQKVSEKTIEENELAWKRRLSKPKSELLRKIELNYPKHYLDKIAQLADDNNCQLLFLYLPESGSHVNQPKLIDFYSELAPVVLPHQSTISNRKNWKDAMHFNDNGAREISALLAEILVLQLTSKN